MLYSQEHDNLGIREAAAQIVRDLHAELGQGGWNERGGADQGDVGAHFGEGVDI